jgi:gluconate 2-dehydrogenase gamma chain
MDFTSFGPKKAARLSTLERGQGDAGQQKSRRHFLTITAAALGGLLIYSPEKGFFRLPDEKTIVHIPLHFFEGSEALIVTAAVSRIFPTDDSGPGAKETGVAIYIDRHLAGPYGSDRHRYTAGPFESGRPELGYQGKATPREIYREELKGLAGFQRLQTAEQDRALKEIESSFFFSLLRQHTLEGMFSDPIHGGNLAMRGWQLIGFPGPQMNNYDDVDKHFGEAFRPPPVSLSSGRLSSENEE